MLGTARTHEASEGMYRREALVARRDTAVALAFEVGQEAANDLGRKVLDLQLIDPTGNVRVHGSPTSRLLALVLGPIIGSLAALMLPEGRLQTAGLVLLAVVVPVALAIGVGVYLWRGVPRPSGPGHASTREAVEVADFSKESVTLRVHNDHYGRSLDAANGGAPS